MKAYFTKKEDLTKPNVCKKVGEMGGMEKRNSTTSTASIQTQSSQSTSTGGSYESLGTTAPPESPGMRCLGKTLRAVEIRGESTDEIEGHPRKLSRPSEDCLELATLSPASPTEAAEGTPNTQVDRLEDFLSLPSNLRLVVMSATPPFYVQYANKAWTKACGWSAEEVVGLDLKFLQGEGTDSSSIKTFMRNLQSPQNPLKVVNYKKEGNLLFNELESYPLNIDPKTGMPKHFGCVLIESNEIDTSGLFPSLSMNEHTRMREVGLPIDRRENSRAYPYLGYYAAPLVNEWAIISKKITLSLAMQYMIETQAACALVKRDGIIQNVNPAWSNLMKCQNIDCEGKQIETFLHDLTQADQLHVFKTLIEKGNKHDRHLYANVIVNADALKQLETLHSGATVGIHDCQLWPCALSATALSEEFRLVIALWVRDSPVCTSTIMRPALICPQSSTSDGPT